MRLPRRGLFGAVLAASARCLLPGTARAEARPVPELDEHDLVLPGSPKLARRCLLLVPKGVAPDRLLVLCHGLGETVAEKLGVRAWADRYGLLRAYERLSNPPVAPLFPKQRMLLPELGDKINRELSARPFRGFAIACPFTPNVYKAPSTAYALDRYADWLADVLLPELRGRLSLGPSSSAIGLDGVSLGGYVALEVFTRRPEAFGAVGTVQGAFGVSVAEAYAVRLAKAFQKRGPVPVRVATSRGDPFRAGAQRLADRLGQQGAKIAFSLTPGPHSQLWLREVGSLELLHDYDRTLPRAGSAQPPAEKRGPHQ